MYTNNEEYIPNSIEEYDVIVFDDIEKYVHKKSQKKIFVSKELVNIIEQEFELI